MAYILGIDAGGTYTDGVLIDSETKVVCKKAKALTTRDNLVLGITNCIGNLEPFDAEEIRMVCLSTTLATNAIVEGRSSRVGVIILGKAIEKELPADDVCFVNGLFNIRGQLEIPLDTAAIDEAIASFRDLGIEAVVVSGYASTRNSAHEREVRNILCEKTDLPVVCAYEITGKLGYYHRTVTAILNAGLIPIITRLIEDTKSVLLARNIKAPVMVVKGDGNFMSSQSAEDCPIETILSGPAASIIGARHLSGEENAVVLDMGGTTSDIARIIDGTVGVNAGGAEVGGWKTQIEAAEVFTRGIGGDSRLHIGENGVMSFGPEKTTPMSLYWKDQPERARERMVLRDDRPYGFTPTDLAHLIGLYDRWDKEAAEVALEKIAAQLGEETVQVRSDIEVLFYSAVYDALVHSSTLDEGVPIVAIGAPAHAWMPKVAARYGLRVIVPEHAEVANAIGAAVGHIEEEVEALVRKDQNEGHYVVYLGVERLEFLNLEEAKAACLAKAREQAIRRVEASGVSDYSLVEDVQDICVDTYLGGTSQYVETRICIVAAGDPDCIGND